MCLRINILVFFLAFSFVNLDSESKAARVNFHIQKSTKTNIKKDTCTMANFEKVVSKTFKFEGGFQQYPTDKGNYNSLGQLIGTNHGISAIALEQYLGRPTTVEDIKSLTVADAKKVYKKLFWDKIRGDEIKNQDVAFIIFSIYIGSPANSRKILARALKNIWHKEYKVSNPYSDEVLKAINRANPKKLFYEIKEEKRKYLESLRVSYPEFIEGWLNRLNSYEFTKSRKKLVITIAAISIVGGTSYWAYKKGYLNNKLWA